MSTQNWWSKDQRSPRQREALGKSSPVGECHYCKRITYQKGAPEVSSDLHCMATKDHTIPQVFSGKTTVLSCHACNSLKAHWSYNVFRPFAKACPTTHDKETRKAFLAYVTMLAEAGFKTAISDPVKKPGGSIRYGSPPKSISDVLTRFRSRASVRNGEAA